MNVVRGFELKFRSLKALIIAFLMILLAFITSFFVISNSSNAIDSSSDSDITLSINSALAISLSNCDSTTNTQLINIDIIPTPNGLFKSNCQNVTVNTNAPGYTLTAKSSGSKAEHNSGSITNDLIYQNPTEVTPLPFIPSTTAPTTTPTTLTNNTWGFAVEERLNFDTTYTTNNENNTYANLPTSDITIYETDIFPLPQTNHKFFYGTKLDNTTLAGTYATTITYTAVGEVVPEPLCLSDDVICIKVTSPGTVAIQNQWTNPITYTVNGSDPVVILEAALSSDIDVEMGDIIEIGEAINNVTFRAWNNNHDRGLVTNTASTGTATVSITKIPKMNRFTVDEAGTTAGNSFFNYFAGKFSTNNPAAINSLPNGSFDTSSITQVGNGFFSNFNYAGILTSLPTGSFDISNITSTELGAFFYRFNAGGALTSLPANSFDISNMLSAGVNFFHSFNANGSLTSLPVDSFDTSNITAVDNDYFTNFNGTGALTSLPTGSFNTSNITSVRSSFFNQFNDRGALTSLPAGSFDTSNITSVGSYFFNMFNRSGSLTSLPVGSFDTSNITSVGGSYFGTFNGDSLSNAGKLQAGNGVTITNKSTFTMPFWQRPFGNPNGTAFSTSVPIGGTITYFAE